VQRLQHILDEHERERTEVGRELHEEIAQSLAGVLFGLERLTEELDGPDAQTAGALREHIAATLEECRALAVVLRPPLLNEFGLVPALETLAARAGTCAGIDQGLADEPLGPALEAEIYRTVEAVLAGIHDCTALEVTADDGSRQVCVRAVSAHGRLDDLSDLAARLSLIGGTLRWEHGSVVARIPAPAAAVAAFPQSRRGRPPTMSEIPSHSVEQ
jgi:signal transduction histidine kinase